MGGLIFYNAILLVLLTSLFSTDLTNQIQNGIDIKNVRMSAIGCAIKTPSLFSHIGNVNISGIKKTPCLQEAKNVAPLTCPSA